MRIVKGKKIERRFASDDLLTLYFFVRSVFGGILGVVTFSLLIMTIRWDSPFHIILLSLLNIPILMFITKIFDKQTKDMSLYIIERLDRIPKIRDFIVKNF